MNTNQEQAVSPIETLTFRKGDKQATVVTDGLHFATYEARERKLHSKLSTAIAYLEGRGYKIIVDLWNT